MFEYGQDIPLNDVTVEPEAATGPLRTAEPLQHPFEYGSAIFPEDSGSEQV